jgi:hypothetical protein
MPLKPASQPAPWANKQRLCDGLDREFRAVADSPRMNGAERPFTGCRAELCAGTVTVMQSTTPQPRESYIAMLKLASVITLIVIALAVLIVTAAPL